MTIRTDLLTETMRVEKLRGDYTAAMVAFGLASLICGLVSLYIPMASGAHLTCIIASGIAGGVALFSLVARNVYAVKAYYAQKNLFIHESDLAAAQQATALIDPASDVQRIKITYLKAARYDFFLNALTCAVAATACLLVTLYMPMHDHAHLAGVISTITSAVFVLGYFIAACLFSYKHHKECKVALFIENAARNAAVPPTPKN